MNIFCPICDGDLLTGTDECHCQCLLQCMGSSEIYPYCCTDQENDDVSKLNSPIGETCAVPSKVEFEELENRVIHLMNVKLDLKRQLDTETKNYGLLLQENTNVKSECEELRKKTLELEHRVQYLENIESNVTEQLEKTSEKLQVMEIDYESAISAGEKLRNENKKLEDEVQSLLRSESSLKNELAARKTELQQIKQDFKTEKEKLESSIKEHMVIETDLRNRLNSNTATLMNVESSKRTFE